ncbi:MAG: LCP family protein, partial [bacterium]
MRIKPNLLEKFDPSDPPAAPPAGGWRSGEAGQAYRPAGEGLHETVLKQHRRRKKIFFIAKLTASVFLIVLILLAAFSYQVISTGQALYEDQTERPSFFSQIKNLITSDEKQLRGETDQRINILLLGIGGKDHAGPYLTDTVILASFIPQEKKVAIISIPRDLVVPISGDGWRKVNGLNAIGEEKMPGNGAKFAAQTLEEVFGLPIHYYGRIDFTGFTNIIDNLGGIKVYVENTI